MASSKLPPGVTRHLASNCMCCCCWSVRSRSSTISRSGARTQIVITSACSRTLISQHFTHALILLEQNYFRVYQLSHYTSCSNPVRLHMHSDFLKLWTCAYIPAWYHRPGVIVRRTQIRFAHAYLCSFDIPRMRLYFRCGTISYDSLYVVLESSSLVYILCCSHIPCVRLYLQSGTLELSSRAEIRGRTLIL